MGRRELIVALAAMALSAVILFWPLFVPTADIDVSSFAPADINRLSRTMSEGLRTGQFDVLRKQMHPRLVPSLTSSLLMKMQGVFPKGKPVRIFLATWRETVNKVVATSGSNASDIAFAEIGYRYPNGDEVRSDLQFVRIDGRLTATAFHVLPIPAAAFQRGTFSVSNLSGIGLLSLLVGFGLESFAIATCIVSVMGPLPSWRTRWLWIAFSLVGLIRFDVVLSTGAISFAALMFKLPPAGLSQANAISPWTMMLFIPVGAICYWLRRNTWRERAAAAHQASAHEQIAAFEDSPS